MNKLMVSAALLVSLVACSKTPAKTPVDSGPYIPPVVDAGPPVCTISCNAPPDAGPDAGYVQQPLAITAVVPPRGPVNGGTSVQIIGKGFLKAFTDRTSDAPKLSSFRVGSNPPLDFTVINDTLAEFTSPPGQAAQVDLTLTNPNGTVNCNHCFTYYAPVLLQGVTPTFGPQAGGTVLTLTGKGFTADTTVLVGDKTAASITFNADGSISATTPSGEQPGAVDLRVINGVGTSSLRKAFRYQGAPQLASSSPGSGPLAGGTVVTVKGAGLSDVTACSVGGVAATELNVLDDGQLQFTTAPALLEGPADVRCVDPQGEGVLRRAFVYVNAAVTTPRLLGVSPTHGLAAGGEVVTVVGVGLDAAGVTVKFGGAAATTLSSTATTLTVRTPPGAARSTAAVTATGFTGTASFVYNVALRAVRPSHGPPAGGTALELDGDGFGPGLVLTFGGVAATPTVVSASLLSTTAPAGAGGAVQVRVADAADPEDRAVLSPGFTYDEPLNVGAVVPTSGAIAGGTYVTVFGAGFAPGIVFRFGTSRAKDVTVLDSHTATMHTPVGAVGLVDISAILDNVTATDPAVFTYVDPTNQGGGASGGPLNGTLNVTVLDSTFTQYGSPVSGATVLLGTDPSTPFQGRTDARGQLTFSDPSLVKAQTVSVSKEGYELVTVAEQASQNMTVYIGQNDANGGSPGSGGGGVSPVTITGKVRGFKAPRPLAANEHEEARVSVAPHSLFYVDPLGYTSPPSPSERTVLNGDGQGYLRAVYPGLYAVYAVYGIVNDDTKVFTPVLMGIHRGIEVNATHPASNEDIVLDMHLDASAPITIINPLSDPATGAPASNQVWSYLDLGAEGVVPLGGATGLTPDLLYTGLPELDGSNFIFLSLSQIGIGLPQSIFFRRQPGDVALGLSMGPLLGFVTILTPDPLTPVFTGALEWSFGPGPAPDLTQVQILRITPAGAVNLWTVVLPGDNTQISLPPTVMQSLLDREPPGEQLEVIITSSRAPRFDYNHWSYGDLGQLNWTAYTENVGIFSLPRVAK